MAQNNENVNQKSIEETGNETRNKIIVGISIISSLVYKAISDPTQVSAALKQILFYYKLLPQKWKKTAASIFMKLWDKNQTIISTHPEKGSEVYETIFEDTKLNKLYHLLPLIDQAILLQGESMLSLINKSLHGDAEEIKEDVKNRYGIRGLNIVHLITTNDIQYLLNELKEPYTKEACEKKFNEWANNYDSIALLVSPLDLKMISEVENKILELSKNTKRDYILVNLAGKMEDCTQLLDIIEKLKGKKQLKYKNLESDISDSGFFKSLRTKLNFK